MRSALLLLVVALIAPAQVAKQANERYQSEEGRASLLQGLGSDERTKDLHPDRILAVAGVRPGQTVADIGTGGGALLPPLSQAVGAKGTVFAEDIFLDFLAAARKRATSLNLANVQFVLGDIRSVKLPDACCDFAFTVDAYHHYDYPAEMLASIQKSLKPSGRLVIVDYYKRAGAMNGNFALTHIRLDQDEVIREVEANGFRTVLKQEHVPGSQWIGVFAKK